MFAIGMRTNSKERFKQALNLAASLSEKRESTYPNWHSLNLDYAKIINEY